MKIEILILIETQLRIVQKLVHLKWHKEVTVLFIVSLFTKPFFLIRSECPVSVCWVSKKWSNLDDFPYRWTKISPFSFGHGVFLQSVLLSVACLCCEWTLEWRNDASQFKYLLLLINTLDQLLVIITYTLDQVLLLKAWDCYWIWWRWWNDWWKWWQSG